MTELEICEASRKIKEQLWRFTEPEEQENKTACDIGDMLIEQLRQANG